MACSAQPTRSPVVIPNDLTEPCPPLPSLTEPTASALLHQLVETQGLYWEQCARHAALAEGARKALED